MKSQHPRKRHREHTTQTTIQTNIHGAREKHQTIQSTAHCNRRQGKSSAGPRENGARFRLCPGMGRQLPTPIMRRLRLEAGAPMTKHKFVIVCCS